MHFYRVSSSYRCVAHILDLEAVDKIRLLASDITSYEDLLANHLHQNKQGNTVISFDKNETSCVELVGMSVAQFMSIAPAEMFDF